MSEASEASTLVKDLMHLFVTSFCLLFFIRNVDLYPQYIPHIRETAMRLVVVVFFWFFGFLIFRLKEALHNCAHKVVYKFERKLQQVSCYLSRALDDFSINNAWQ